MPVNDPPPRIVTSEEPGRGATMATTNLRATGTPAPTAGVDLEAMPEADLRAMLEIHGGEWTDRQAAIDYLRGRE
jgi:hypothetical protein